MVFLHGLLGSGRDWQAVLNSQPNLPDNIGTVSIDLPCHGESREIPVSGFEQTRSALKKTLQAIQNRLPADTSLWLVGYSLGGRIAMDYVCHTPSLGNLCGLVIENSHYGLQSEAERQIRRANDHLWAERFETQPIRTVLTDWYCQPVFSSLKPEQKQRLVEKRSDNLGKAVALMLRATSLAEQPYLLDKIKTLPIQVHYLCGEDDTKFLHLAAQSGLPRRVIAGAGHNVHVEQPEKFALALTQLIHAS